MSPARWCPTPATGSLKKTPKPSPGCSSTSTRTPVHSTPRRRSMSDSTRPLAFVTGGSSGIGFAIAEQLAEHGYDVALSGSSERVHDSAKRLQELGADAYSHQADAATEEGVESFWRF